MRKVKLLSVVVPCYNEEEMLLSAHERIVKILNGLLQKKCENYEIIYIDDGSSDNTLGIMKGIYEKDKHVRLVALRHNFGHQSALSAGLAYAKGDAAVSLDADLQDPPEKIEEMISFFEQGYDLVLGIRNDRSSDSFFKRFFAESYYRLIKMMGINVVYNHGDFRLMGKDLVDEFNRLHERNRFIRAMILDLESRYAVVSYSRQTREAGKSKYTTKRMVSFCMDGIMSFSYMPLRIASIFGVFMCIIAFLNIGWVLYQKFAFDIVRGWASTMVPVLLFGGLQFLFLGLIGEYVGRIYTEVKQRPLYSVKKEYSHDK